MRRAIATAVLPLGWQERLLPFRHGDVGASEALCLEPHDLVVSKLVAGRQKDFEFAAALLNARLIDADILLERLGGLPGPPAVRRRVEVTVNRLRSL